MCYKETMIQSLTQLLNAQTPNETNSAFIEQCKECWDIVKQLLTKRFEHESVPELFNFFQSLCRWRVRAARSQVLTPAARECGFIITCAVRLITIDLVTSLDQTNRDAFVETVENWNAASMQKIKNHELLGLQSFDTLPKDVFMKNLENNLIDWSSKLLDAEPDFWAKCSYVSLCDTKKEINLDESCLKTLAFYDWQCCRRLELIGMLETLSIAPAPAFGSPAEEDKLQESVCRWVVKNTLNISDELYGLGKECLLLLSLSPYALTKQTETNHSYLKLLANWCSPWATQALERAAGGFLIMNDPSVDPTDPRLSFCFLNLFNYFLQQLFDIDFIKLFLVHDVHVVQAIEKLGQFRIEQIRNPAPFLVFANKQWWLVFRSPEPGGFERAELFETAQAALIKWLLFVKTKRRGVLFVGKNISTFIEEVLFNTNDTLSKDIILQTVRVE